MRKRVIIALLLSLCLVFASLGCGGEKFTVTKNFETEFGKIETPIGKDSAKKINSAYDAYFLLSEEDMRSVSEKKATLDSYAAMCNAIVKVTEAAENIGAYSKYSVFKPTVEAALKAYGQISVTGAPLTDKDVTAAKAVIDAAKAKLDLKQAQIDGFIASCEAIPEYDRKDGIYTDWAALIGAAQTAYEAVSVKDDDMMFLEAVSAARKGLKERLSDKVLLDELIKAVTDRAAAVKSAFDTAFESAENITYNETVNAAMDLAEVAVKAAEGANLTADAVLSGAMETLNALHAVYDAPRYTYEFDGAMEEAAEYTGTALQYEKLAESLGKADAIYAKIPESARESVAAAKEKLDTAKEGLPFLGAQFDFISAVNTIDVAKSTDIDGLQRKFDDVSAKFAVLEESFAYGGGLIEVDSTLTAFDAKKTDFEAVKGYVVTVNSLPAEIVNNKENYEKLTEAETQYALLSAAQTSYALIKNAYVYYHNALLQFRGQMHPMFTSEVEAFYKDGTKVESGMKVFEFDSASGLLVYGGALENYLQILYNVASLKPGGIGGKILSGENKNADVDDPVFDAYMSENFEYVYRIYGADYRDADKEIGVIRKPLHYDETLNQVPTLEEIKPLLPVYLNEEKTRDYGVKMSVEVKADASDENLSYTIGNSEGVRSVGAGTLEGDLANENKLSSAHLIGLEYANGKPNGVIKIGRDGDPYQGGQQVIDDLRLTNAAQGKFLKQTNVGAYDVYFYRGESTLEEDLIDWVRVVPATGANTAVNPVSFLGSSILEKDPTGAVKPVGQYNTAGVTNIKTAFGVDWIKNAKDNYSNCFSAKNVVTNLLVTALGYTDAATQPKITIVCRLKVTEAAKAKGYLDSDFSAPLVWSFEY